MNNKQSRKIVLKQGFIQQKIGSSITIFIPDTSELVEFNETGSYVFSKIKKRYSEEEIIRSLIKKYDINIEAASKDVKAFVDMLYKKGLVLFEK